MTLAALQSDMTPWRGRLDALHRRRLIVALALFVLMTLTGLHGSSLGEWDRILKTPPDAQTTLFGSSREIRSDEWMVQTPFAMGQAAADKPFPRVNPNFRSDGQDMFLNQYMLPVLDESALGKPFTWGWLLFGPSWGLAFYWWGRAIALLLLGYEFLLTLTDSRGLSLVGGLGLLLAPATQWWFSTAIPDVCVATLLMAVAADRCFRAQRNAAIAGWAALVGWGLVIFVFSFLGSFQVPMLMTAAVLVLGLAAMHADRLRFTHILALLLALFAAAAFIGLELWRSREALELAKQSIYPGARLFSGSFSLFELGKPLSAWALPWKELKDPGSPCDMSSFLHFLPILLLAGLPALRAEEPGRRRLTILMFLLLAFFLIWMMAKLPPLAAKLTLMRYAWRMSLPVGFLGWLLSVWLAARLARSRLFGWPEALIGVLLYTGFSMAALQQQGYAIYLGLAATVLSLAWFGLMGLFLLAGKTRAWAVLVLAYLLVAGVAVNPLVWGAGALTDKEITHKILELRKAEPNAMWAGVGSRLLGPYLSSLGLPTYNAVQIYPDLKRWRALDAGSKNRRFYNRYAHITLLLEKGPTRFELARPDRFTVRLAPKDLGKTGIRYLLSRGRRTEFESYIEEVAAAPADKLYIYRVKQRAP